MWNFFSIFELRSIEILNVNDSSAAFTTTQIMPTRERNGAIKAFAYNWVAEWKVSSIREFFPVLHILYWLILNLLTNSQKSCWCKNFCLMQKTTSLCLTTYVKNVSDQFFVPTIENTVMPSLLLLLIKHFGSLQLLHYSRYSICRSFRFFSWSHVLVPDLLSSLDPSYRVMLLT